ncbi:MAG: PAS domain-containing protein, partial [Calditrichaeota bacterium]|nr:PAS domain-containing protein [Calditrichota bacterium]
RELQESNELLVAEISNRQRAEMALSVEKECRAVALASVAEGIFFLDGDGFVTFVNPKAEQLLNYDPNRAIGKKLDDVLSLWDHDGEKVELMILSGDPGVARGGSRMLFLENSKKEKVLVSLLWAPVVAGPRNSKAAVVVIRELRSA